MAEALALLYEETEPLELVGVGITGAPPQVSLQPKKQP